MTKENEYQALLLEKSDQIEKQNFQLLQANEELRQFAYIASHDLKEPLRMIGSFTQLLFINYRDKLDEESGVYFEYILEGVTRMNKLLAGLLQYATIGKCDIEYETVDLNDVVEICKSNLKLKIDESVATVESQWLPEIVATQSLMIQLFQNLISNALKFQQPEVARHIHIATIERADDNLFCIKDNGIGIAPEHNERIFVIFQRLHGRNRYEGTGIGLAIGHKRIALALNVGNEGNLQRLLGGEGWTVAQIMPVLQSLTPQELVAVQQVWDHFESYRPQIAAKERRIYGKEPAWVVPGSAVTAQLGLRGGYYPIKYDPASSQRAEEHADAEGAKRQLQGAYTTATTRRSFTKARVEEVSGRPLLYTLTGLYSGVIDVFHDLAWHEWLIDTNRLLKSKSIDAAIRNHYGPEVKGQLKTWAAYIAEGEKGTADVVDAMLGYVRQSVSVAGLGFNVVSAAMQPLGITQSIVRVGPQWVGRGISKYIAHPISLTRGAWSTYVSGDARVGGSTLTMQLARLLGRLDTRSPRGKLVQIGHALLLEARYSKDEILEAYLNLAPYGGNIEGAAPASLIYFDKPVGALTPPEALTLAVLPQAPARRGRPAADADGEQVEPIRVTPNNHQGKTQSSPCSWRNQARYSPPPELLATAFFLQSR